MDTNAYVMFLLLGGLIIAIDGQILYRNGRRYLASADQTASGGSMGRLIAALFHLVMLGVLALLSAVNIGDGKSLPSVVSKLGLLLLALAIVHGAALAILSRVRDREVADNMMTQRTDAGGDAETGAVVTPVPGQRGRGPSVSPTLEREAPYSTPES